MKQNNYKPQLPDVMEAIFDAAYLIFDLVAAIWHIKSVSSIQLERCQLFEE